MNSRRSSVLKVMYSVCDFNIPPSPKPALGSRRLDVGG
jgi:hypothetical protein